MSLRKSNVTVYFTQKYDHVAKFLNGKRTIWTLAVRAGSAAGCEDAAIGRLFPAVCCEAAAASRTMRQGAEVARKPVRVTTICICRSESLNVHKYQWQTQKLIDFIDIRYFCPETGKNMPAGVSQYVDHEYDNYFGLSYLLTKSQKSLSTFLHSPAPVGGSARITAVLRPRPVITVYDEFIAKSKALAEKRVLGDPFDLKTEQGPQVDNDQLQTIIKYVECGKKEGAQLITGGKQWGDKGFFYEPTIFANVKDQMTIAQEEIFGPVMSVIRFDTMEDLVGIANNTIYGLAAAVVTNDIDKALYVANNIRAGSVWVNCFDVFDAAAPFGGYKQSGIGRELGEYGLEAYTEVKTVTIKVSQKNS
ncbi:hypothetical protein Y032_0323g2511 [Ancylostoma ceylanicum]|uniref:Aldehyde dehydrogenase domain-containing protein n=1 Tax=Ancylostoma ceylanicum TaxID=53326 RepID=A0A016S1L0_9BILA|nr:hypothetical protein Y032_0323g2511 [Ancylostoma ceylanicum]